MMRRALGEPASAAFRRFHRSSAPTASPRTTPQWIAAILEAHGPFAPAAYMLRRTLLAITEAACGSATADIAPRPASPTPCSGRGATGGRPRVDATHAVRTTA